MNRTAGSQMCKLPYWSPLVNPSSKGGDHLKPLDVGAKNSGWSPGQPQFTFYRVAKKKEERNQTRQYRKNSPFGGDRLTTPHKESLPYGDSGWSPLSGGGVTTPDRLSGEVTL